LFENNVGLFTSKNFTLLINIIYSSCEKGGVLKILPHKIVINVVNKKINHDVNLWVYVIMVYLFSSKSKVKEIRL